MPSNRSSRQLVSSSRAGEDTPCDSGSLRGNDCWALPVVVASVKTRPHKTGAEICISEFTQKVADRVGSGQTCCVLAAQDKASWHSVKRRGAHESADGGNFVPERLHQQIVDATPPAQPHTPGRSLRPRSSTNDDAEIALTIRSCDGPFTSSTNDHNESIEIRDAQSQETSHSRWTGLKQAIRYTLYLLQHLGT